MSRRRRELFGRHHARAAASALDRAAAGEPAADDLDDDDDAAGAEADIDDSATASMAAPSARFGLVFVLTLVAALAGLAGWLGFRAYGAMQDQRQHARFLEAGREAAVRLTTISYTEADSDAKRILDSATGPFADDFQKRSQPFVAMVKQVQSKTVGSVTEAGLESVNGNQAKVLVAVSVKTSLGATGEQPPRLWRMRIEVQKVGDATKVSNVEFVP